MSSAAPPRLHLARRFPGLTLSPFNARTVVDSTVLGGVGIDRPRSKVAIIGAGFGHEEARDVMEDPSWEVWGLNVVPTLDRYGRLRCDRWFELHQRHAQSDDDMTWIRDCPVPIYTTDDLMDASPNAVRFPIEALEEFFGGPYWACTFAYQVALAMFLGFEQMGVFGAELAYGDARERTVEWANLSWWIGYAEARGMVFWLPGQSRLGRHEGRYGLEYDREKNATADYVALIETFEAKKRADKGEPPTGVGG